MSRTATKTRRWAWKPHPNSLLAKALRDPELMTKINRGRRRMQVELALWEDWWRRDCGVIPPASDA